MKAKQHMPAWPTVYTVQPLNHIKKMFAAAAANDAGGAG